MAVGEGSMARANKAVAKKPVKSKTLTGTSEEVVKKIVYQNSFQILDRDAAENESFQVGDAMPIYYY